jgi:hypothetical protein
MTNDLIQVAMATWAAKDLPARLDVAQICKLLGFTESDIQILMALGKLTPLGDAWQFPQKFCHARDFRWEKY